MRRRIAIITALALSASTAAAATPAKHDHMVAAPRCPRAHVALLAADTRAVVYKAPVTSEGLTGDIFACAYGARRSYDLGPTPEGGGGSAGFVGTGPFALAGTVIAYSVGEFYPSGHSFNEIVVRNLVNGAVIHKMPNGLPGEPGDIGSGETTAIVVKRDGSMAWIARTSEAFADVEVHSVDAAGSHVLAASSEIEPDSLALAGSTLYWTEGGKPFSVTLN